MQAFTVCIIAIFSLSACGQEHQKNEDLLKNNAAILLHTVLLNNQNGLLPVTSLEKKSIAAVNLGFSFQAVSDSILNKYTKITPFNSIPYEDAPELYKLEDDLKYFNTVIISITSLGTTNAKYINFIKSVAKNKSVIDRKSVV